MKPHLPLSAPCQEQWVVDRVHAPWVLHLKKNGKDIWRRTLTVSRVTLSQRRRSRECHAASTTVSRMPRRIVDGLANATLRRRRSHECHAATASVPRMPRRIVDSLADATPRRRRSHECHAAMSTAPTVPDVNGAGNAGLQRHRQRQTSDSLTPTLRNWENTRSARV